MKINEHYLELEDSYLFSTVARKQREYQQAHPEKKVIRLSIGDVTLPLAPVVIKAMEDAVKEMGSKATFRGTVRNRATISCGRPCRHIIRDTVYLWMWMRSLSVTARRAIWEICWISFLWTTRLDP